MKYRVLLKRSAERELDAIREPAFSRIKRKLLTLEEHPRPIGIQKLHGQEASEFVRALIAFSTRLTMSPSA